MLILNRRPGESFSIEITPEQIEAMRQNPEGRIITVALISNGPHSARIGIDAPRDWLILRDELTKI